MVPSHQFKSCFFGALVYLIFYSNFHSRYRLLQMVVVAYRAFCVYHHSRRHQPRSRTHDEVEPHLFLVNVKLVSLNRLCFVLSRLPPTQGTRFAPILRGRLCQVCYFSRLPVNQEHSNQKPLSTGLFSTNLPGSALPSRWDKTSLPLHIQHLARCIKSFYLCLQFRLRR